MSSHSNDTVQKTLIVTISLCLVCSILVSSAAVFLKPIQEKNKVLDMKKNILSAAGLYEQGKDINEQFSRIKAAIVNLETGDFDKSVDADTFNQKDAAKTPGSNYNIPGDKDLAGIKVRAKLAKIYLVMKEEQISQVILPVHGKGLWSTMYGFLALEADANTVKGITFYSHGETPGLGGEIDNRKWQAQWSGKEVFSDGKVDFKVIKGNVDPDSPKAKHEVDGLSGATITSDGVTNLVRYWLSDDGFGPFLKNFREAQKGNSDG